MYIVGGIFTDISKLNTEFKQQKFDLIDYMNDRGISNFI